MNNDSSTGAMHIGLHVSSTERSLPFYTKLFGAEPVKVRPGYVKFELADPALVISLIEGQAVRPDFGHLGFRVSSAEELNIRLWQARKDGLLVEEEMDTRCCYALQDKFWVTDPDGMRWEVYRFRGDAETNDVPEKGRKAACCAD